MISQSIYVPVRYLEKFDPREGELYLVGSRCPRITYKPASQRKEEWIQGNWDLFLCVCIVKLTGVRDALELGAVH